MSEELTNMQQIEQVLAYDPFAEEATETPEPVVEVPAKETRTDEPPAAGGTDAPPATKVDTPPVPAAVKPEEEWKTQRAAMEMQLAALRQEVATIRSQPPQQVQQTQQPTQPQGDGLEQLYRFTMPKQLSDMLNAEDAAVRDQGIAAMMQAQAMAIHRNVTTQLLKHISEYVPNAIRSHSTETDSRKQVEQDFYGKYPQLNKPELRPMVQQAAMQTAKELGVSGWSEALRDAIAAKVLGTLASLAPVPAAAAAPAPARKPFATPAAPARSTGVPPSPNSPEAISSALFG